THQSAGDRVQDHGQFPTEALILEFLGRRIIFETSGSLESHGDWNRLPAMHLALQRKWSAFRTRVLRFAFGAAPNRQRSFPAGNRCVGLARCPPLKMCAAVDRDRFVL